MIKERGKADKHAPDNEVYYGDRRVRGNGIIRYAIKIIWNDESLSNQIELIGYGLMHDGYIDDKVKTEE